MKTILISSLILTLALFSTLALAQDNENSTPAEQEWAECVMKFSQMNKKYGEASSIITQAVKSGATRVNVDDCFLIVTAEAVIAYTGDTCLDLGIDIPKDSPNKKFIKKIDSQILVVVKSFRRLVLAHQKICNEIKLIEDTKKKDTQTDE